MLDKLGIPHPETQLTPPADLRMAGYETHRRQRRPAHPRLRARNASDAAALFSEAARRRAAVGRRRFRTRGRASLPVTRQWISPSPAQPFRFGGAVSLPDIDAPLSRTCEETALEVATGLRPHRHGVFRFHRRRRHSASARSQSAARRLARRSDDAQALCSALTSPLPRRRAVPLTNPRPKARAMAILHAERGALTLGETPWPEWSADRGRSGHLCSAIRPARHRFCRSSDGG